jgi:hypothetical protein
MLGSGRLLARNDFDVIQPVSNKVRDFDPLKFTIVGFCADCHRDAPVPRIDEYMEIPALFNKLSCSRCGSRDCSMRITFTGAGRFTYSS